MAEAGLFVVGLNTATKRSVARPTITRTGARQITRTGSVVIPRSRTVARAIPRPRPSPSSPASIRIGAGGFGSEALAPVLLTAAGQLGFIQGRRYAQAKRRRKRLASSRSTTRARGTLKISRATGGAHGRPSRTRRGTTDTTVRTSGTVARAARALSKALQRSRPNAAYGAAQKAIAPLKVKGRALALAPLTPIASRKAELARSQAALRKANAAAEHARAAATRAAEARAAAAAKAAKAQERALASNAKAVQRAHDQAQKALDRADANARKAIDKAQKLREHARAVDAKAAAKQAKDSTLGEKMIEYVRGRLNLPNAATAVSVATGLPMPGVNPDAVAQQEECREQDNTRRKRFAKQARCAGVPCGDQADQAVPAELPDNVVQFPKKG